MNEDGFGQHRAVRRLRRKRFGAATSLGRVKAPNLEWEREFIHDSVENGRSIPALSLVDSFTLEYLARRVGALISRMRDVARPGPGLSSGEAILVDLRSE